MRSDMNQSSSGNSRKQGLAILVILALGVVLGILILRMGSSHSESDGHGHGHSHDAAHRDTEHHGTAADDHDHDHDDAHDDTEHHEEKPAEALAGGDAEHGPEQVALSEAQIQAAGLTLAQAGPARIRNIVRLPGEIRFNEDWTAHVVPRMAGIVEHVPVSLGQAVKKGDVLAVLASTGLSELRSELLAAQRRLALARTTYTREKQLWQEKISAEQDYLQAQLTFHEAEIAVSNAQNKLAAIGASAQSPEGLNRYEIRAPFDGLVVEKHIANGEAVTEASNIFTISDLSSVWAEIIVPASSLGMVRVGEKATVQAVAFDSQAEGKVSYVGALLGQDTRTAQAWVVLPNPEMAWRPGLFVNVDLLADDAQVPVAVQADAIQEVDGRPVVFLRDAEGFIAQPVQLGRRDVDWVEIRQGLTAGAQYVSDGSFVLKSELGKGSAEHTH